MTSRKLYGNYQSGNVYKVRLMLSLLNLSYQFVILDLAARDHRSADFLALNPLGQIPVFRDGEVTIRDSQAILVYLSRQYAEDWLPTDAADMAKVTQWLSIAANEIEHSLTKLKRCYLFNIPTDQEKAVRMSHQLLQVMDQHLQNQQWLECSQPTIADIACFPYVNSAEDSRIDLAPYPNVIAWLERIHSLSGYINPSVL